MIAIKIIKYNIKGKKGNIMKRNLNLELAMISATLGMVVGETEDRKMISKSNQNYRTYRKRDRDYSQSRTKYNRQSQKPSVNEKH